MLVPVRVALAEEMDVDDFFLLFLGILNNTDVGYCSILSKVGLLKQTTGRGFQVANS